MVKISTPMPPIQEEKARQKRIPRGRDSMSDRAVPPVVVKPEALSKKQSAKLGNSPENQKGRAPNRQKASQINPTTVNPSREKNSARAFSRDSRVPKIATGRMV